MVKLLAFALLENAHYAAEGHSRNPHHLTVKTAKARITANKHQNSKKSPTNKIGRGDQDGRVSANGSLLYVPRRKIWRSEI